MIIIAVLFYYTPKESVLDSLIVVGALVGGPVLAMYLLGFFTTRVTGKILLITMAMVGVLHLYFLLNAFNLVPQSMHLEIHNYWVGIVLDIAFIIIGYALSWIIPSKTNHDLTGLTVWTSGNQITEQDDIGQVVTEP